MKLGLSDSAIRPNPVYFSMKMCTKCEVIKDLNEFGNDKNRYDGLNPWCKECANRIARERTAKKKAEKPKPIFFPGIKWCTKCCRWKDVGEFGLDGKNKDGSRKLRSWCKACCAEAKRIRMANDDRPKKKYPPRTEGTKACTKCEVEKYVSEFSRCANNTDGLDYKCKECSRKAANEHAARNREKKAENTREWSRNNREHINDRNREKYDSDIEHKLKVSLRTRVGQALRGDYKPGSAVADLGNTAGGLKIYLKSMFKPHPITGKMMGWENWGVGPNTWQIHHKKPLSSFDLTDREQFLEACHYTNLQPLWFEEHVEEHGGEVRVSV